MTTRLLRVDPESPDLSTLDEASACVRDGGLVVFPTETVYGIAVNLDRPSSLSRLLKLRESPPDKDITMHVASREQALEALARPVPTAAQRLMRRFWPGPLTLVLPARQGGMIGVRYPRHRVACELILRSGVRVGAPSANPSGKAPAHDAQTALGYFEGRVEYVVDAGPARHGASSTVVRVPGPDGGVEILREGVIPAAVLQESTGKSLVFVCTGNTCRSPMAEALIRSLLAGRLGLSPDLLPERGWQVASAGTAAGVGQPATTAAVSVVRRMGGDLDGHRSRPITVTMIEEADRVYVMTKAHLGVLREWMPDCAGRIELLDPAGGEIEDPFGSDEGVYQRCAERIRDCLRRRMDEVLGAADGGGMTR